LKNLVFRAFENLVVKITKVANFDEFVTNAFRAFIVVFFEFFYADLA